MIIVKKRRLRSRVTTTRLHTEICVGTARLRNKNKIQKLKIILKSAKLSTHCIVGKRKFFVSKIFLY